MTKKIHLLLIFSFIFMLSRLQFSIAMNPEDSVYKQIKNALINAVNKNEISAVEKELTNFQKYAWDKLKVKTWEEKAKVKDTLNKFREDLLQTPKDDSVLDLALKKRFFPVLSFLLKIMNRNYKEFLEESKVLNPKTDTEYEKIKNKLILGTQEIDINAVKSALKEVNEYIRKPFAHIDTLDDLDLHKYYLATLSHYLGDLLSEPIQIAATNKSYDILYSFLNELNVQNFLLKNIQLAKPIIAINNQSINALFDQIILKKIKNFLSEKQEKILMDSLTELLSIGISKTDLQALLIRAFNNYGFDDFYNPYYAKKIILSLQQANFINTQFEDELKKTYNSAKLIHDIEDYGFIDQAASLIDTPGID